MGKPKRTLWPTQYSELRVELCLPQRHMEVLMLFTYECEFLWKWGLRSYNQDQLILEACLRVKSLQSCPTLCDPRDCSPLGSSVLGIFQARVVEPFPPPGDLPNPGIEPGSPAWQVGTSALSPLGSPIPLMSLLQIVHRERINVSAGNSIMRPGHELLLFKDYVSDHSGKFICKLDTPRINPRILDTQPT